MGKSKNRNTQESQPDRFAIYHRRPEQTEESAAKLRQSYVSDGVLVPSEKEYKANERPPQPEWMVLQLKQKLIREGLLIPGAGFQKLIDKKILDPSSRYGKLIKYAQRPAPQLQVVASQEES